MWGFMATRSSRLAPPRRVSCRRVTGGSVRERLRLWWFVAGAVAGMKDAVSFLPVVQHTGAAVAERNRSRPQELLSSEARSAYADGIRTELPNQLVCVSDSGLEGNSQSDSYTVYLRVREKMHALYIHGESIRTHTIFFHYYHADFSSHTYACRLPPRGRGIIIVATFESSLC